MSLRILISLLLDSITAETINLEIQKALENLIALTAKADGCQQGQDVLSILSVMLSNTLFNVMRGGIFDNDYKVDRGMISHHLFHSA
jgi:hypothetical protein